MTQVTLKDCREIVRLCVESAEEKYGVDLSNFEILFNMRGRSAGQCRYMRSTGEGQLRFNKEAIALDFEQFRDNTVPHEVAHAVAFVKGWSKEGHGSRWKAICEGLGGSSERCHTMQLTKARQTRQFLYETETGHRVTVSSVRHNKMQRRGAIYRVRGGGKLDRSGFIQEVSA